jgi:hypothetical protein
LKVARIRYGLKIKRYATVFYFTELTPDMQVEFDRIKRIIEESIDSPLIVDLISPRFTVESVLKRVVTASFTSVILM